MKNRENRDKIGGQEVLESDERLENIRTLRLREQREVEIFPKFLQRNY